METGTTQDETGGGERPSGAAAVRVVHVERDEGVAALAAQYYARAYPTIAIRRIADDEDVAAAVRAGVDCVVTDHRPPETDATAVVAAANGVDATVPVVVFSATPDERIRGADGIVAKRSGLDGLNRLAERIVETVATAAER